MTNKLARILITGSILLLSTFSLMAKNQNETETLSTFEASADNPHQITAEPLTLSIWFHARNFIVYDNEWAVEKAATEMTNISLDSVAPKNSTSTKESFQIHLASGQLADIVGLDKGRDDFMTYGEEGAFLPLNDLIKEHAPDLQAFLDTHPSSKNYITAADGNIYFIPYIADGAAAGGFFIRQDWLDTLNLDTPDTVQDYYDVLTAFKNLDPNGNGEADEIPFFDRANDAKETFRLVTLWGGHSEDFYVEGGKVSYSAMQPEYKEGMINLAKWYQEGLIDAEVLTRGKKSRDILFGNNTGGGTHDWFGSTSGYSDKMKASIPGFNLVSFAPPTNTKGEKIEEFVRAPHKPDGWAISASNPHPVETIKYFNFFFSEEGRRLANFGIEGVHYDMVGGKPMFKPEVLNADLSVLEQLNQAGAQIPRGFQQDFSYELQWMNDAAKSGVEMYINNGYLIEAYPVLSLNKAEKDAYDKAYTNIDTYADEMRQKWLLGAEDVEAGWDEYIETLKEYGVESLVSSQQTAYDRL
ncbi:MAG: extracellular solute-binding protein [Spirochaetaceae bacterium]